tara:strand:- start:2322 stop:3188 length:867 start_codon:yes stop_codon:yes gene_type:complete
MSKINDKILGILWEYRYLIIILIIVFLVYYIMKPNNNKVVVFDLDETLGYFTELGVFYDGLQDYYDKNLPYNYVEKLLDLYPEFLRRGIINILKYIKTRKQSGNCRGVYIYTNNQGPKIWANSIKNYLNKKIDSNYKLFDKVIGAYKVGKDIIEPCRTTHNKTVNDFLNCAGLPNNTEIFFLDDQYHKDMRVRNDKVIYYLHLEPYIYQISSTDMINRYLKSNLWKGSVEEEDEFRRFMYHYMDDIEPIKHASNQEYKMTFNDIMFDLRDFLKSDNKKSTNRGTRNKH